MGTKKHRRSRRHDLNEDRLAKLNAENASLDLAKRANHRMGKSMRDKLKKEKALLIEQIKTQQSHITGSSLEGSKMASEPSIYVDMLGERRRFKAGTRGGQAWQQEMSKHRKLRDVEMEKLIAQGINPNPFNLKPVQHEPLPDIPEAEFRDTNDQTMFAEPPLPPFKSPLLPKLFKDRLKQCMIAQEALAIALQHTTCHDRSSPRRAPPAPVLTWLKRIQHVKIARPNHPVITKLGDIIASYNS